MVIKLKRYLLFTLLGLSFGFLNYLYFGGWWNSAVETILIIFISFLIWNKDFLKRTGLQLDFKTVIKSVILAVFISICSLLIIKYLARQNNIRILFTNWREYFHDIFYILNEEIVVGALLLFALVNKGKIKPIIASIGLAFIFSLIHFIFYKWLMIERGIIGVPALFTLFCVGLIRNNLILQTGHIGYSWALHFGWMVIMFGSWHVYADTNLRVTEPVRFNTYLGSMEMLLISTILAGLSLFYFIKKHSPQHAV